MAQAKQGDTVKVHYTGKLDDGSVFDSSECSDEGCDCPSGPFEFTIGQGQVIPGFEQAIIGMNPGDQKTIHIPVDQAYGERIEDMVAVVDRKDIPQDLALELGNQLEVTQEDGSCFPVVITDITDSSVTLDANHPLAGRDLTFELKLMEIK